MSCSRWIPHCICYTRRNTINILHTVNSSSDKIAEVAFTHLADSICVKYGKQDAYWRPIPAENLTKQHLLNQSLRPALLNFARPNQPSVYQITKRTEGYLRKSRVTLPCGGWGSPEHHPLWALPWSAKQRTVFGLVLMVPLRYIAPDNNNVPRLSWAIQT